MNSIIDLKTRRKETAEKRYNIRNMLGELKTAQNRLRPFIYEPEMARIHAELELAILKILEKLN